MDRELTIWTPVIMCKLDEARYLVLERSYEIKSAFSRIEYLKSRLKECKAEIQGRNLEVLIVIDILSLGEENSGKIGLKTWEEKINDQIPLSEMGYYDKLDSREVECHVKVLRIPVQGGIENGELKVIVEVEYSAFITSYQEVYLNIGQDMSNINYGLEEAEKVLKEKMAKIEGENHLLRQKLFLYEQDILSLKKGIKKAEKRNLELRSELNYYKSLLLQNRPDISTSDTSLNLGRRIKKLFSAEQ
ncbi:hypothetical protein [Thermosyntropha sp.]|uniref:hypothetical protein n=1 Tax=Thermosyntropha sp. TaxID=2740820 RepID=UPI0025D04663|nr:hypothetical protein [Thermosyntropha sp.]MBO8159802.1 hypothetical protein [Thermosyntropha sp.]